MAELINHYGTITMNQLHVHCNVNIDTPSCNAQNSAQIYEYIMNIIDEAGKRIIVNESEKYTIRNIKSGPILFKLIMSKEIVDN